MGDEERFERVSPGHPGDEILRRRVRKRARLRLRREIPGAANAVKIIFTETPLVRIVLLLMVLVSIFSALLFVVERDTNPNLDNYGKAVWWILLTMQTHGNDFRPESWLGGIIGGAWAVFGTFIFWGAIIGSITYYFMQRREHTRREIVKTIKDSLDDLEDLSLEELELLKESTDSVIIRQIQQVKTRATGGGK